MSFLKPQFEPATLTPTIDIEVCVDCYDESIVVDDITYYPKTQDELGNEFNNHDEFSRSSCDCCGSYLAGSRYTMSACDPDSEPTNGYKWRLSAPGYLDCTDWSFAESLQEAISDCLGIHGDSFDEDDYRSLPLENFDSFLNGYLVAMAFTASDDDGEPIYSNPGGDIREVVDADDIWEQIDDDTKLSILADCVGFYVDSMSIVGDDCNYDDLGSDFHLTRTGHGAGFWDGGWPEIGDELTKLVKPYGECELRVGDDGKLYV